MTSNFFSIIMLAMALYVLVGGITGKGKLYAVDGVPEEKLPKFKKSLRILYIIMGLFMALNTGLSYLRDQMYTYQAPAAEQTETVTPEEAEDAELATEAAQNAAEAEAAPAEEPAADEAEAEAVTETAAEAAGTDSAEPETATAAETAGGAGTVVETTSSGYQIVRTDKYPSLTIGYKTLNVLAFIMLGITMAAVIGMFVVINKFVDKEAARKAQEEKGGSNRRGGSSGSSMPASAFEFDDEPEEKTEE